MTGGSGPQHESGPCRAAGHPGSRHAVVPDAQAAARANKNFLARAVRFLVEEASIRQVQCRDSGRSSQARLCGPRAEADTAMDPSLWCDGTKDPYLSCAWA